jgi:hypothetical protein
VLDAVDGTLLDTRTLSSFDAGKWLVWDISGHVKIRVTCLSGFAAVSGFFFGTYAPPVIIDDPNDVMIETGQVATFNVKASGIPLFYQWQRSNDGGATWSNISGANAASYSFATALSDNGSRFQCAVTNAYGMAMSCPARLATSSALPLAPVITSPLVVSTVFGQAFSYTITATNNPTSFDAFLPPMCWSIDTWLGLISSSDAQVWYGANTSYSQTSGTEYIPICAMNAGGMDIETLTVFINPTTAPVITNATLSVTGMVGVVFSNMITATCGPTSFSASGLPAGLTLNTANGLISGVPTPAAVGTTNIMIGAKNANGTGLAYLTITILNAPTFLTQPVDLSVPVGHPASFSVTTTGQAPLFYQWLKNGTNILNATNASYTIGSAALTDAGLFSVTVSNIYRAITSSNAALTVTTVPVAPTITTQPLSQTIVVNQPVTFTVAATGTTSPPRSPPTAWRSTWTAPASPTTPASPTPGATPATGGSATTT